MRANLSFGRAVTIFAIAYLLGSAIVTVIARIHDESWMSGPVMVGLSFPTAIVYFLILWSWRRWRYLSPTMAGIAVGGCLCAFYPTIFGYFPVYFFRWDLLLTFVAIQFLLLGMVATFFAWWNRTFDATVSTGD